ncbi:MAG: response regulator, partial [Phycisphaerales bacterium]|nr:response regulator [Phycisphaerales bacterium]
ETQLKRLGYRAECVESGEAAVEAIDGAPFDLILMDRQMPGLDGLEATRLIRARERERGERRTPVVALTADALDSARRECLAAGMDDFLVKPVSGEDLAAIVTRWVNYASA